MTKPPKVSIGLVVYNHAAFIEECLDSIRLQTYPQIELLVSDDCSRDNTVDIIRNYQEKHPDFTFTFFTQEKNLGVTSNCNFLFERMTGDYIGGFSGDDIMLPERIACQVEALENKPKASFSYSNCEWFLSKTNKKICNHFGWFQKPPRNIEDIISDFTIPTPTLLMRRDKAPAGFYDQRLKNCSDFLFTVQLALSGEAVYVPKTLVRYRKHDSSIMANDFCLDDRKKLIEIYSELFSEHPRMKNAINAYKAVYYYAVICEAFVRRDFKTGLSQLPKVLPRCFSSIKWLLRDANIALCFIKGLRKKS